MSAESSQQRSSAAKKSGDLWPTRVEFLAQRQMWCAVFYEFLNKEVEFGLVQGEEFEEAVLLFSGSGLSACGLNSRELLAEHSGYNVREGGLE